MDPITTTIAKELATKVIKETTKKAIEKAAKKTVRDTTNRIEKSMNATTSLPQEALTTRMEAAAHSACKFFNLPEPELIKGNVIGVYMNRYDLSMRGDKFVYNLNEFKDLKSLSFEDMSKIWSHECGHRVLRFYNLSPWSKELGSDFFMGVRSEMLGLPNGNIEAALGKSQASLSHPPGNLRLQAIQYGREVVQDFKKANVPITMQNMRETFRTSHFARIKGNATLEGTKTSAYVDDKAWHNKEAAKADSNARYYTKEAQKVAKEGDTSQAQELQNKARIYEAKAKEEIKSAEMSNDNQLVEKSEPETIEKHRSPKSNGMWEGTEGNSKFVPDDNAIPKQFNPGATTWGKIKETYNTEGINFKDGYPDFSEVSKGNVEIDNFTTERYGSGGNFEQADQKLASQRGCSIEEVRQWRADNNYTWHEVQDCKTMQKVPRIIHNNIPHDGGISKLKNAI